MHEASETIHCFCLYCDQTGYSRKSCLTCKYCRFKGFNYVSFRGPRCQVHEQSLYTSGGFCKCMEASCPTKTKTFSELRRHTRSKHCLVAPVHYCPEIHCKYHVQGFKRRDKLLSHIRNIHQGAVRPGIANRAIVPKAARGLSGQ